MTEGTRGGDVNRPGSTPEIVKLKRSRCYRCGLLAPKPIVVDSACTNLQACRIRVVQFDKQMARRIEDGQ